MEHMRTMQNPESRTPRRLRLLLLLLAGFLCATANSPMAAQSAKEGDVAIIVQADTPVTNLTLAEVRKIFRGDKQYWTTNLPVVLLVRAPVARERDVVLKQIYQMTEAQFRQYWVAKIFRAESVSAPKLVYSTDMTNQLASTLPGAISFLDAKQVGSGVKVVRVDGKLPGESGYPLR